MADNKDLVPDEQILSGIFPNHPNIPKDAYNVISNTFDACTFRIQFDTEPSPVFSNDLLVRVEESGSQLSAVAAFQKLAHHQLADLVPATLAVGKTTDSTGRELQYSVAPYFEGTTTLDDMWSNLTPKNQQTLMHSIVRAVERLQKLDLKSDYVRGNAPQLGWTAPGSESSGGTFVGGPEDGYYPGIKQLLAGLAAYKGPKSPPCEILDTADGIAVQSLYDEIGRVELSHSDLKILQDHVVLCHNDLEPRNILVKKVEHGENGDDAGYELAAIIDWEMAGFYPFSYELGAKDALLGSSNLSFSWYALFKQQTAFLVPDGECHEKLIRATRIIAQSKGKARPRNVGFRFQERWIERERVELSVDGRRGWIREVDPEGDVRQFTKEDDASLELEVLKELGYI